MKNNLKIWVDIGHTPHAPFFVPIIRELEKMGHEVVITARDSFQTLELLDLYGLKYKKIGIHYGGSTCLKIYSHLTRTIRLFFFSLGKGFSVAASHGSPSQQIAAYLLGIPSWMSSDYEPTFDKLMNLCRKVAVPEIIPDESLWKTLKPRKISKYPGLKEDAYVQNFRPNPGLLKDLNISRENIVVTVRAPATYALYHNAESEELTAGVINYILSKSGTTVILLPRTHQQREAAIQLIKKYGSRVVVPPTALNGLNLIWNSDLVVSGGGTMNREAAALGVPVYSIFRGPVCAVDRFLERERKLIFIESLDDIEKIKLEKRKSALLRTEKNFSLSSFLAQDIIATAL